MLPKTYQRGLPRMNSHPKLQALNRFNLPFIRAMEIGLRGANVRMAHQGLNGSEIVTTIQEGSGKRMPHDILTRQSTDFWEEGRLV